jgi:hypothetical protein
MYTYGRMEIVTGEKIQQLCDIYIGEPCDFYANPLIGDQTAKHCSLETIQNPFYNPARVFCYSHRINDLRYKIPYFMNDFILVTHNSDGEVRDCSEVRYILNYSKLVKWYAQNIRMVHEKLAFLPIGIANSQWPHGNLANFTSIKIKKTRKVYFNFNVYTNLCKRMHCFNRLKHKIEWLCEVPPQENIQRLSEYEFCICPEGNGVDTHRLWEALYVKTIPIVIKSDFIDILLQNNVPLVVLDDWSKLDESVLDYSTYNLDDDSIRRLVTFSSAYIQ